MSQHSHMDPETIARHMREIEDRIQQHIDTIGWSVIMTYFDTDAGAVPIAYTVGLTVKDLPELCIVGVRPEHAKPTLDDLAQRVTTSGPFPYGQRLGDVMEGFDVVVVEGPATGIIRPTIALYKYGPGPVRLQQVIWPDPEGRFPWDAGYSMPPVQQPIIADPSQPPPPPQYLVLAIDKRRPISLADWADAAPLVQSWGPDVTITLNPEEQQLFVRGLSNIGEQQLAELADRMGISPADITSVNPERAAAGGSQSAIGQADGTEA